MTEPNTNWAAPEGSSPAPAPVVVPKKKSGALVNVVLVVGALVAVGGVAFAIGRTTAPAQATGFRGAAGQGVTQGGAQAFPGGMPGASFDPGQAGPGGLLGGMPGGDRTLTITGTVTSLDGTTMVITTASGDETSIDVSGADYHAQADASASDVSVGTEVSVATEGFGFRRPDASAAPDSTAPAAGSGQITATDVTITSGP